MNCAETQLLLHAYIDAELHVEQCLTLEQHLEVCPACRRATETSLALRAAIRESQLSFQAPCSLRKRLSLALPATSRVPQTTHMPVWSWMSAAALLLFLLGGLAFWGFTQWHAGSSDDMHMARAVVDSHERSLVDARLVDFSSSDPNSLKDWFESKIGFSPPVINLTLQGFALIGGRQDFLDNHSVAAIVYKSGKHVINLFIWPANQNTDVRTLSLQGYYLTHWTRYGMNCWAVADLNESQLQQFARLIDQNLRTFLSLTSRP